MVQRYLVLFVLMLPACSVSLPRGGVTIVPAALAGPSCSEISVEMKRIEMAAIDLVPKTGTSGTLGFVATGLDTVVAWPLIAPLIAPENQSAFEEFRALHQDLEDLYAAKECGGLELERDDVTID